MNIFHKVTLNSLRKNKTRTVVTIIGIMLSAAMICAVTTFVSSIKNYLYDYSVYNEGDWHGAVQNTSFDEYLAIRDDNEVKSSSYLQILGYAKIDSKNEYKPYFYVVGGDRINAFATLPVHIISGRLPKNNSEIIIPEHVLSNGGMNYKIGDSITLDIGKRMDDGFELNQSNPCYEYDSQTHQDVLTDETLEVRESRTYKIVGIYERPSYNLEGYTAPGYTAFTVSDKEPSDVYKYDAFFSMHNPGDIYDYLAEFEFGGMYNSEVLMYLGISYYSSFYSVLYSLAFVVIALIMFGSVSLIYNAFSISVSERTKQFGLLSSIGATKKQLRKSVIFEALAVSAVGIPLGIITGITGIGVTLYLIGEKFSAITGNYEVAMHVSVSWQSVLIAVVVAILTVLISSYLPSRRACRVSAVEAIRQNTDIKAKNKPVKTSKLIYKLFGLPGVLATKHYKRSKKKYRATILSLFMSIVLFVSASAFTDYLTESVTGGFGNREYDIAYYIQESQLSGMSVDESLELIKSEKNVIDAACCNRLMVTGKIPLEYVSKDFEDSMEQEDGNLIALACVYFVNDGEFNRILKEKGLEIGDYYNTKSPLALAFDVTRLFDYQKGKYISKDALKGNSSEFTLEILKEQYLKYGSADRAVAEDGTLLAVFYEDGDYYKSFEVPYSEAHNSITIRSEKVFTEYPYFMETSSNVHINYLFPLSMREYILPEYYRDWQNGDYDYAIKTSDHTKSFVNLKSLLLENNLQSENLYDMAEAEETDRNTVTIIRVFAYGFIVLISLIAAANVFNTISTNIGLRRREFAMLKSVGMAHRDFNKMMNFECLLYGSRALLYGLPVSGLVTYLIYKIVSGGYETDFRLPWGAIGIAVLSVFLVVFATMVYSMRKIKKDNPIDALKNENI